MFGGKTTKLLSAIDRYKYQGRKIYTFKPNVDTRYSEEEVVTHWGAKIDAYRISSSEDMPGVLMDDKTLNKVIAVDEAFMIQGIADCLKYFFQQGHTILVSSLQLSSTGQAYNEVEKMLPYATKIEICPAVCSQCSYDAYYTQKTSGRLDHEIEVGGADMYEPRCFKHFNKF